MSDKERKNLSKKEQSNSSSKAVAGKKKKGKGFLQIVEDLGFDVISTDERDELEHLCVQDCRLPQQLMYLC